VTRIPVLYLAPWVDYGGSDKGTIDWFRWIDRSRFAPSLITTQPSRNSRLAEVAPFAEEIWPLPDMFAGVRYPEFIVDFITSRRIAMLHVMNARLGFDLLPDLRALADRPRVVVQLHVEEQARDGYVRYVTTRYGNLVDCFSVTSEHLAEIVYGYGIPRDRIEVIRTGVDADREFSPDLVTPRPGIAGDEVQILYPGRLVEQKDPLLMVDVARELARRGLRFRLHVVGSGELEPEVRRRVVDYGLSDRIAFEPPTNELAPWYAACDLLLMTSVFEGVPYVIYESLAMGLPVIAPALPGNVELMGATGGTLVAERSPAAFADALEPLIADRELRGRAGAQGRELMLERYSLREMADRHAAMYERLLADRPVVPPPGRPAKPTPFRMPGRPSQGTPPVSVLTPCFNHGRWLRDCVESVRAQDYPQIEMIVVDDGSTEEDTRAYLEELDRAPDVKLVRMARNSGPSAARNRGLEHAQGRYILPLDADNILLEDAVSRLVIQLQGAGEDVGFVYPAIQYFGNREDYFEPPAFNGWLLTRGNYIDTCALIDRQVFDDGARYPEEIVLGHEDWDFFLTLLERGIHGEPARGKTLRYRKHGFTRSDVVDWSMRRFHGSVPERHPQLFGGPEHDRGNNAQAHLKARWSPALTVIALEPVRVDSEQWAQVRRGLSAQHLRDFEFYAVTDAEVNSSDLPPVRRLPQRLADRPGELVAYALELAAGPDIAITDGTGAELLGDPGSLERILRLLEQGEASGVIGFTDAGQKARFDWCLLPGDDPDLRLHSLAWSRRDRILRRLPDALDRTDPIGDLARWFQLRRVTMDWRHLPAVSRRPGREPGTRVKRSIIPRSRPEISERHSRLEAETLLPGRAEPMPRWKELAYFAPPCMSPLMRYRRPGTDEWTAATSHGAPPGFEPDRCLGLLHWMAFEGTSRIVEDPQQGWRLVERGAEPDAVELERTLGYADQVAFPLLEPLMLCRHARTGAPVMVCGEDDPLRAEVEWPQLAVLGWIEQWPANPRKIARSGESVGWLRGLIRTVDRDARRHRVAIGADPGGDGRWELGALLDRDPGGGIPAWTDSEGRLHTGVDKAGATAFSPVRSARWALAPLGWRGFGRPAPRARAVARRSVEALASGVHTIGRPRPQPRRRAAPSPEPQGWLLADDGPHRAAIYVAFHPVTSDQLVTRDLSEARELGYGSPRMLGYALGVAPVTASLAHPGAGIPWASRFGQMLSHRDDPLTALIATQA
jgi:glycosyltransferase involved in cell wall biosynthesis